MKVDPVLDQTKFLAHCNVIGTVRGQAQMGEGLWGISMEFPILSTLFSEFLTDGQMTAMVFFDKEITYSRTNRPTLVRDFQILIRHAYMCLDEEGKVYFYIAAGYVFASASRRQSFKAACYTGR